MAEKCYSVNNEEFNHSELNDAVAEVFDEVDIAIGSVRTVFEGDAIRWKASDFGPYDIIDTLACNAGDNAGEYADDWPEVTKDQEDELHALVRDVVDKWADDHGLQPNFYHVENVKEIQVKLVSSDGDYEVVEI